MAGNTEEEHCDFRIEGNWFESACTIYAGDTSTIIAQVRYIYQTPASFSSHVPFVFQSRILIIVLSDICICIASRIHGTQTLSSLTRFRSSNSQWRKNNII